MQRLQFPPKEGRWLSRLLRVYPNHNSCGIQVHPSKEGLLIMNQNDGKLLRAVVAGGRNYFFSERDKQWLDTLPIGEVVSGCARGADSCGEEWANKRGIPVKRFPADWGTHGKAAGYLRNRQMAEYAEAAVLFPGGRGTASMMSEANRAGIKIFTPPWL